MTLTNHVLNAKQRNKTNKQKPPKQTLNYKRVVIGVN